MKTSTLTTFAGAGHAGTNRSGRFARLMTRWRRNRDMAASRRALSVLSDSTLRDIGLSRAQIHSAAFEAWYSDWN